MVFILTACAVLSVLAVQCLLLHRLLKSGQPPQQQETEKEAKSPMDEGFDNIMRYEAGGWTGFEAEDRRY